MHLPKQLGRRRLIETRLAVQTQDANRLQHSKCADAIGVSGVFWRLERDLNVALGAKVVDLVGLDLLDDANQVRRIGQVSVVKYEATLALVRILVEMIDALGIER